MTFSSKIKSLKDRIKNLFNISADDSDQEEIRKIVSSDTEKLMAAGKRWRAVMLANSKLNNDM